ncbi:hypothetical protein SERLA73DRAFT_150404 [Serpula lacrymans var. lacrymans S7.3]|uniref:BAG domain-containing protein n=2 Tax=Serpula lacrymans var. lacrymans TaxID=341189 RepID=F8PME6_SERL3|nr:uncharacterized protein SERLADRAFT_406004 [Serpula lacrymans var. lacrymans S7.9]EGO02778.1 hypothetical protein SERLA73DRAFT_150404 [Serpula lacrymans var. lacrymans S7.3]EGO28479.1 hypothetical protein SERLADRAFT_406004 [Serpula lacrymans var. lacrymans S7.9]
MFVLTSVPIPVPIPALHPHFHPPSPIDSSPRKRYMAAALAEARLASMQYVWAALARDEAVRRERQLREEAHRREWMREAAVRTLSERCEEHARRQRTASMASMGAFPMDGFYECRYEPAVVHAQPCYGAPWLQQRHAFYPEERARGYGHGLHHRREHEHGRRVHFEEPRGWQCPDHYREEWRNQEGLVNASHEEQDITLERLFNLVFGGGPARDAETAQLKATPPAQSTSPAQRFSSEARVPASNGSHDHHAPLNQDVFEQELRDTLQAIVLSLFTASDEGQLQKETTKPTSGSSSCAAEGKGKGKVPAAPAEDASPKEPTSKDVAFSLETIRNVGALFEAIQSDVEFPRDLNFDRASSVLASAPDSTYKLAYTSRNAPVRYFEHAMSALLTQLDAVDSFGSEEVRVERRVVVSKIEKALEEVEREVEDKLGKFKWRETREKSGSEAGTSRAENAEPVPIVAASGTVPQAADTSISGPEAPQPVVEVDINTNEPDAPRPPTHSPPSSGPDHRQAEIEQRISHQIASAPSSSPSSSSSELASVGDVDLDRDEPLPPASSVSPSSTGSRSGVDSFLLPAPSRAADVHDELIVVDSDQDGDAWSEVEA